MNHLRYPWKKWLARKKLTVVRGEDFDCQIHSMAQQFRNRALLQQIKISVRIDGDTLTITRRD